MQWTSFLRFASLSSFASLQTLPPLEPGHSRLFLCRHGETVNNQLRLLQGSGTDTPLSAAGQRQAAALAQSLSALQLDAVMSSDLCRAVQTADFIADEQRNPALERVALTGLREQAFGTLEGLPIADCRAEFDELNAAWRAGRTYEPVGGGESPDDVLARAQGVLWGDGLLGSRAPGRQVAVVAHSTINKVVLSHALGKGLPRLGEVRQVLCCVNVLDYAVADGKVSVVAVNIAPEAADVPPLLVLLRVCGVLLMSGQRGLAART